jgi:hypothetical protein
MFTCNDYNVFTVSLPFMMLIYRELHVNIDTDDTVIQNLATN